MKRMLSLGVGVQSSTVLLMSCVGELPKLDAAVFSDPQWESKKTYDYFEFLKVEAASHGIPVVRVTRGDLRADAIEFRRTGGKACGDPNYKRWASMPLWVLNPDGTVGIINRQCTSEYKIEPIARWARSELLGLKPKQRGLPNSLEHWFGISDEEKYRVRKSPNHWQTFRYPLIADVTSPVKDTLHGRGFDRQDCLNWLAAKGYPLPPRSACIGCPFHSDEEWLDMKTNRPDEWADAVAFDREMRAADAALQASGTHPAMAGRLVGLPYLHRSCVPLDEVEFKIPKGRKALWIDNAVNGMGQECQGMCGV